METQSLTIQKLREISNKIVEIIENKGIEKSRASFEVRTTDPDYIVCWVFYDSPAEEHRSFSIYERINYKTWDKDMQNLLDQVNNVPSLESLKRSEAHRVIAELQDRLKDLDLDVKVINDLQTVLQQSSSNLLENHS